MPVIQLNEELIFPPVDLADENGIVAMGGDLSAERLILAYQNGIFPWYSEGEPILWWSPDPRFVLFPESIKISRSMRKILKRKIFHVSFDKDFPGVIEECRQPRKYQRGTWITDDMMDSYIELHEMGVAHSVEVWFKGELAGGLYGISLGRCFFGESMFSKISNASKTALITLAGILQDLNFKVIDCQVYTDHLYSLGAREIPRKDFIKLINKETRSDPITGKWAHIPPFSDYSL